MEQNPSEQPGGGQCCPQYPSHPDKLKSHTANAELHSDHNMPRMTKNIVAMFKPIFMICDPFNAEKQGDIELRSERTLIPDVTMAIEVAIFNQND